MVFSDTAICSLLLEKKVYVKTRDKEEKEVRDKAEEVYWSHL